MHTKRQQIPSDGDGSLLQSVEYDFISIIFRSTLTRSGNTS